MAPELLSGESASPASDQYAFCVALYEALYDEVPFSGETLAELTASVLLDPLPPRPSADVPEWIHAALVRGLARAPDDRFESMAALVELLGEDPEAERALRERRTRQIVGVIVGTIALLVIAALIFGAVRKLLREREADTRLNSLNAEILSLRSSGDESDAQRLLEAFVTQPENRDLAVVARAYLLWAEAQTDNIQAIDAYASAYISANRSAEELAALRGLIDRLSQAGLAAEAAAALRVLERLDPAEAAAPGLRQIRLAAALSRRDLPTAASILSGSDAPDDLGWAGLLTRLSRSAELPVPALANVRHNGRELTFVDVDGDGAEELVVKTEGQPLMIFTAEPSPQLLRSIDLGQPRDFVHLAPIVAGEPLVLATYPTERSTDFEARLLTYSEDGSVRIIDAWPDSASLQGLTVDLDGDGQRELYVVTQAYTRRFWRIDREPDGRWSRQVAHAPTDAASSDLMSVLVADMDDDGDDELIVVAGPWKAYDLRVFKPLGGRALDLVARRSFGSIATAVALRMDGADLIAFNKNDAQIAPNRFPKESPKGEPAGVYIAGVDGRSLDVLAFLGQGSDDPSSPSPRLGKIRAADLDGDGQVELVIDANQRGTAIVRWSPDRPLEPRLIAGVRPLLVADLDDDGAAELLVKSADEEGRCYILGIGEALLPPLVSPDLEPRPVPESIVDPRLAAAWRRAEQLVAIGVPRRSAAELSTIGRISGDAGADMLVRAGELYAGIGEDVLAAENYLAAATRPDIASEALAGAANAQRRLGNVSAALELTRRRFAFAGEDERLTIAAEEALYAAASAEQPEVIFTFERPLDPRWTISDPVAVARDLGEGALSIWAPGSAKVASFPLFWDGGPAALDVELELGRIEWGAQIMVSLDAPGGERWLMAKVGSYGVVVDPKTRADVIVSPRPEPSTTVSSTLSSTLRVRIQVYPQLDLTSVTLTSDGEEQPPRIIQSGPPPPPGPLTLNLSTVTADPHFVGHAWVRSIRAEGFRVGERSTPEDELTRTIAEHALEPALEALASAPPDSVRQIWRIDALLRTGAIEAAAQAIGPIMKLAPMNPLRTALQQRLRRGDMTAWHAAKLALGPDLVELFITPELLQLRDQDVEPVLRLLDPSPPPAEDAPPAKPKRTRATGEAIESREAIEARAAIEAREADGTIAPTSDASRRQKMLLTDYVRGLALARAGRYEAAKRALTAALARLSEDLPHAKLIKPALLRRLLSLAARMGDLEAVMIWIQVILDDSPTPYLELELLRADELMTDLIGPEIWQDLLREVEASRP